MTKREEFEKWLKENYTKGYITDSDRKLASGAWQARGKLDAERVDKLEADAKRYQLIRKLNPREFGIIYDENIKSGVHFDVLIDRAICDGAN